MLSDPFTGQTISFVALATAADFEAARRSEAPAPFDLSAHSDVFRLV